MDHLPSKSRITPRFRPLAWVFVLSLVAADIWVCLKFWPTLTEPVNSSVLLTKAITTRPFVASPPPSPGTILHPPRGGWSVIGRMIEMIATPIGPDQFTYRYSFTKSDAGNLADWQAMLRLQSEIAAATRARGLPPGLSADQVAKVRPLLMPVAAPLDEPTRRKLQAELMVLASKATGKKLNDPSLASTKLALLNDLNAAAATLAPALHQHLAEIQRYVGPSQWARLMRRGATRPAPLHAISLTTQPIGLNSPALWEQFAVEAS